VAETKMKKCWWCGKELKAEDADNLEYKHDCGATSEAKEREQAKLRVRRKQFESEAEKEINKPEKKGGSIFD
jgi:hypothetical protein